MTNQPNWLTRVALTPPERILLARALADAVPIGMHTCQTGRADGATFAYFDEYWECPFCDARGEGWERSEVTEP